MSFALRLAALALLALLAGRVVEVRGETKAYARRNRQLLHQASLIENECAWYQARLARARRTHRLLRIATRHDLRLKPRAARYVTAPFPRVGHEE